MPQLITMTLAFAAFMTGTMAGKPLPREYTVRFFKMPPPTAMGDRKGFVHSSGSFFGLALSNPEKLIAGDAFDKEYQLPSGTMEKCLDAIFHGHTPQDISVGTDYVILNNAPLECTSIVGEVTARDDNFDAVDMMAVIDGENSIRINGFDVAELDYFVSMDPTHFNVHLV